MGLFKNSHFFQVFFIFFFSLFYNKIQIIIKVVINPEKTATSNNNIANNQTTSWSEGPRIVIKTKEVRQSSDHTGKANDHEDHGEEIVTQKSVEGIQNRDHRVQRQEEGQHSQIKSEIFDLSFISHEHFPDHRGKDEKGDVQKVSDDGVVLDTLVKGVFESDLVPHPNEVVSQSPSVTRHSIANVIHCIDYLGKGNPNQKIYFSIFSFH